MQEETSLFGIIYWLVTFVALFWVPTAGTFVDKYNRKYVFLVLGLISGVVVGLITLSGYMQGHVPLGLAAMVFAATFFNYNLHYQNLYAFLQEITEPKHYGTITSAVEIQGQIATALAGAGAAILLEGLEAGQKSILGISFNIPFSIEAWELHEIFALDTFTYFLAAFFVVLIRYKPMVERKAEMGKIMERLRTGFNFLKSQPYIFLFGVVSFSIFVTVLLLAFYLSPIYVDKHMGLGGDVYAISEVTYAFGAIFAGFAIRQLFRRMAAVGSIILMTFITAILFATMAFTNDELLFYILLFVLGVTNAGTRIQRITYLFKHVPNQVYGRANSIFAISNILARMFFLALFSLPLFHKDNNVVYTFVILTGFLLVSSWILIAFYSKLVSPVVEDSA